MTARPVRKATAAELRAERQRRRLARRTPPLRVPSPHDLANLPAGWARAVLREAERILATDSLRRCLVGSAGEPDRFTTLATLLAAWSGGHTLPCELCGEPAAPYASVPGRYPRYYLLGVGRPPLPDVLWLVCPAGHTTWTNRVGALDGKATTLLAALRPTLLPYDATSTPLAQAVLSLMGRQPPQPGGPRSR